jgi:hypothetical protein
MDHHADHPRVLEGPLPQHRRDRQIGVGRAVHRAGHIGGVASERRSPVKTSPTSKMYDQQAIIPLYRAPSDKNTPP